VALAVVMLPAIQLRFHPLQTYAATAGYQVVGNQIIDPGGQVFIVKGITDEYGPWLTLNDGGYAAPQYTYAQRDFSLFVQQGINYVRMWVSPGITTNTTWQTQVENAVSWATGDGLVVEFSIMPNANTNGPNSSQIQAITSADQWLAATFASNPKVWINPLNEPECSWASGTYCSDLQIWQVEEQGFIDAVRAQGFRNPLVIQGPNWSWKVADLLNPSYALADPQNNLIYAAHRYGNNNQTFWGPNNTSNNDGLPEPQSCAQDFGNAAATHAIIVDEFGDDNGSGFLNSETWTDGFIDWVANWVNTGQGSGAVAFEWFWSDGNSQTGTSITNYESTKPSLVPWGSYFTTNYLKVVPATRSASSPTVLP
jgi:hypothetical protein